MPKGRTSIPVHMEVPSPINDVPVRYWSTMLRVVSRLEDRLMALENRVTETATTRRPAVQVQPEPGYVSPNVTITTSDMTHRMVN
jgi:hypothetical protein